MMIDFLFGSYHPTLIVRVSDIPNTEGRCPFLGPYHPALIARVSGAPNAEGRRPFLGPCHPALIIMVNKRRALSET